MGGNGAQALGRNQVFIALTLLSKGRRQGRLPRTSHPYRLNMPTRPRTATGSRLESRATVPPGKRPPHNDRGRFPTGSRHHILEPFQTHLICLYSIYNVLSTKKNPREEESSRKAQEGGTIGHGTEGLLTSAGGATPRP